MCMIIYRPAENSLSIETLELCSKTNKDGWGIMMPTELGLVRHQGMKFEEFLDVYNSLPKDVEMAIHFRFKTHGDIKVENNHPFVVLNKAEDGADMMAMHNGTINIACYEKSMSDTWHWVQLVLRPLMIVNAELLNVQAMQFCLESTVGSSRVLILDDHGKFTFLNEKSWCVNTSEKDGCRYSTTVPKKYIPPVNTGEKTAGNPNGYNYAGYYGGNYIARSYNRQVKDAWDLAKETFGHSDVVEIGGKGDNKVVKTFQKKTTESKEVALLSAPGTTASEKIPSAKEQTTPDTGKIIVVDDTKGGEITSQVGLLRFLKHDQEVLVGLDDDELTNAQLRELNEQEIMDGILPNKNRLLGLEFTPQRTNLLTFDDNACDELSSVPEDTFEGESFNDILEFVLQAPEEAALFIYKMCG